jgi:K+-sensing histidine kinase KdpD
MHHASARIASDAGSEIAASMSHLLTMPLAALRIALEDLVGELGEDARRRSIASAALSQVTRLARNVETLVDYAAPRKLRPLPCSAVELVHSAMRPLAGEQAARMRLTLPAGGLTLMIDGPLFCSVLRNLIEDALQQSSGAVELGARPENDGIGFLLVRQGRSRDIDSMPPALPATGPARCKLELDLARREIARMRGKLTIEELENGVVRTRISMPTECEPEAAQ